MKFSLCDRSKFLSEIISFLLPLAAVAIAFEVVIMQFTPLTGLLILTLFLSWIASSASVSRARPEQRLLRSAGDINRSSSAHSLNFTSSSPHIFSSLRSLLQQWPNTFFPNGHSIVPCQVPAYTNLYHGRRDDQLPPDPEWFAFDIEMSYGIMGSMRNSHMLTVCSNYCIWCATLNCTHF